MQQNYESLTPQFLKNAQYNQDDVQNSIQMGQNRNLPQPNLRTGYKSPQRSGYQSRYPASFGIGRNNENYQGNINSQNNMYVSVSPPKYNNNGQRLSPTNNNRRQGSPIDRVNGGNSYRNRNLTVDVGNVQSYSNYTHTSSGNNNNNNNSNNGYSSPMNGYSGGSNPYITSNNNSKSLIPSPYTSLSYNQQLTQSNNTSRSIIELQKLVSQLKLSLQQSLTTQNTLQDQLHKEKSRCFQLSEIKRKLQQELSKMQFQLQRITSVDLLGQREIMVKYEAQVMENQRLNQQVTDTVEEGRRVKNQCRELMSENGRLREECDLLRANHTQLLTQMDTLSSQLASLKQLFNESAFRQNSLLARINSNTQAQQPITNPSTQLNNINTTRTNNYDSAHFSQNENRFRSPESGKLHNGQQVIPSQTNLVGSSVSRDYPIPQGYSPYNPNQFLPYQSRQQQPQGSQLINYDMENSKLVDDYNRLLMENQSMKKLYKEFYQQSPRKANDFQSIPYPRQNKSISQVSDEYRSTDPNFYPSSSNEHNENLQTFQKNELYQQISILRQEVIDEMMDKYFNQALKEAQNRKVNVLVVFIKLLRRDIETIERMVVNYLQARDLLKKQLNVKKLAQGEEGKPTTQAEIEADSMWSTVKDKLKTELKSHQPTNTTQSPKNGITPSEIATLNINAYFLALFRLLTLVQKYESGQIIEPSSKTLAKIKHSALKYVHKIHQESCSNNNLDKVSMRR